MSALQTTWFAIVAAMLAVYAALDGFDLGVGFWHLFLRRDDERRALLRTIGHVWDGNEVWLIAAGGALFAAFPAAYAAIFSAMYLAMMLVLLALILRATAIEFRHHVPSAAWRSAWDAAFAAGSILASFLFGVATGNILRGLPLDDKGDYAGGFLDLLNPYSLLFGFLVLTAFAGHGALYIALKTSGDLHDRARVWASAAWSAWAVLAGAAVLATIRSHPHLVADRPGPWSWALPAILAAAAMAAGLFNRAGKAAGAFFCSAIAVACTVLTIAAVLYPCLVPDISGGEKGITVFNASSSERTLRTMLAIAAVAMPLVIGYTVWIHLSFRGKADAKEHGYY